MKPSRIEHFDYAKPLAFLNDKPIFPWSAIFQLGIIALVAIFDVALLVHSTGACK